MPESQPPERTEAPPFEVDKQPPDLTPEEEVTLEQEGKAALFETGELFPEPGEVVIPADLTEQLLSEKNGAKIAAAKKAEAAAAETPAPEGQEDARQEWEKPLDEIKAEQQLKRRGRPPKEDKDTSGQVGRVDKVVVFWFSTQNGNKKDAAWRHPMYFIILFRFKAVADKRQ